MEIYPNNLKSRNFGCVKAPGLNDRKQPHISNIGSFTIVQSRELSRQPKSDFSSCLGIDILSLFPEFFRGPFDVSMLHRAQERGLIKIGQTQIRDFAKGRHKIVDDRPYGGGPGMVLKPQPVVEAIRSVKREDSHVIYLSPQGNLLTAKRCEELAKKPHLILLCGHYEGVDERALQAEVDEEISIGDYVLTNGAVAAIVLVDAVVRFIPGVLGNDKAAYEDTFQDGLFDCPHYTRPQEFEQMHVPEVLLNGNHAEIEKWRKSRALEKTLRIRPDLCQKKSLID